MTSQHLITTPATVTECPTCGYCVLESYVSGSLRRVDVWVIPAEDVTVLARYHPWKFFVRTEQGKPLGQIVLRELYPGEADTEALIQHTCHHRWWLNRRSK